MLAMELGPREAARRCNLNENTVLAWSDRGEWLAHLKKPPLDQRPASMRPKQVINAIKPADALAEVLAERKKRTKLAQSAYLADASEDLERVADKLSVTDAALQLATMASKVYPEDHQEAQVMLQFFSISPERVEPEHVTHDAPMHWSAEVEPSNDPML